MIRLLAIVLVFSSVAAASEEWQPSDEQKAKADALFATYMGHLAGQRYSEAYELQAKAMKRIADFSKWERLERLFRSAVGDNPEFGGFRATWYKDPADAPEPGIYVAYDYNCRYSNANICNGYVVLHSEDGNSFSVMRHERNYIDKESERKLRGKSAANKAVKPFAALTRTSGAPQLFAHGFAMIAQTPLHTSRRLPGR